MGFDYFRNRKSLEYFLHMHLNLLGLEFDPEEQSSVDLTRLFHSISLASVGLPFKGFYKNVFYLFCMCVYAFVCAHLCNSMCTGREEVVHICAPVVGGYRLISSVSLKVLYTSYGLSSWL